MPIHNSELYLEAAMRSVLEQSEADLELIAVDDASEDRSAGIVEKLEQTDCRVIGIKLQNNVGAAQARNIGLDAARGRYVAFLDSDDFWETRKLEWQLEAMKDAGCPICTCSYWMHFEEGSGPGEDRVFHVPERIHYADLLCTNYFSCSTLMLERSLVPEHMFDGGLMHEDYGAWLVLMRDGLVACGVDEPLATYRVRGGSRSSNKISAALGRWQALDRCTGEPLQRRIVLFLRYAVAGIRKYELRHE